MRLTIFYIFFALSLFLYNCGDSIENEPSNTISSIGIHHKSINSIDLNGIEIIDGPVYLFNTDATDLSFLSGIKEIRGLLDIGNHKNLESLNGLENLQSVGSINISLNKKLTDISALSDVKILNGLYLNQNGIEQAVKLNGLVDVTEGVYIKEQLENLEILSNLKSAQNVQITETKVRDLSDLENLQKVDVLSFKANSALEDYCGIKNVLIGNDPIKLTIIGNRSDSTIEKIILDCE